MKKNVSENILAFFKENHSQEFAGGALELMDFRGTTGEKATGSTITRKLRKLTEQGLLKVTHGAHNHSYYSLNKETVKPKMRQIVQYVDDHTVRITEVPV